jgi:sterol desaturase/sphingolipid hydroxylase (fatty acid hydroxylase superfamily)
VLDTLLSYLTALFGQAQQAVFEAVAQPLLYHAGLSSLVEDAFDATGWLMIGLIEVAIMLLLIRPLERWRPVEAHADPAAVRVDVLYSLIHRLGLFRLGVYLVVQPVLDLISGRARLFGMPTWQLDAAVTPVWPGLTDTAWFSLLLYLLVFDFADYWIHRGHHRFGWWWSLHALHHSQRQMTLWTDSRNHLFDDTLRAVALAVLARLIGVGPGQFLAVVMATQLLESLAHANVRCDFGPIFGRVLVSPRFHRRHHAAGVAHPSGTPSAPAASNFAVLFPVWDVLFRSARFNDGYEATGIPDQWPQWGGRSYGSGFWQQQWLGLQRLRVALTPRRHGICGLPSGR